jgi:hypothetical protein
MAVQLHALDPSADPAPAPGAGRQRPARAHCPDAAPAPRLLDWRGFHSELQRAAIAATQTGAPLSLLMLEPGGRSRRRRGLGPGTPGGGLAGLVTAAVGERALLARYDAERLAVILVDTDLEAAIGQAERIARDLAARRGAIAAGPAAATAIGIAQFREDESLGHLIQRTAEALRRARIERGLALAADRGARERPAPCGGTPARPAAYALKDDR